MKLDSIAPNAHYDMHNGKPAVFQRDNDGSFLYRFNIRQEMGRPSEVTDETQDVAQVQVGWQCVEVRIYGRPTKANIKKAIIRSLLDETAEFDLVNSYNKHVLGVAVNESAVNAYKAYLQLTEDLDVLLSKTL